MGLFSKSGPIHVCNFFSVRERSGWAAIFKAAHHPFLNKPKPLWAARPTRLHFFGPKNHAAWFWSLAIVLFLKKKNKRPTSRDGFRVLQIWCAVVAFLYTVIGSERNWHTFRLHCVARFVYCVTDLRWRWTLWKCWILPGLLSLRI